MQAIFIAALATAAKVTSTEADSCTGFQAVLCPGEALYSPFAACLEQHGSSRQVLRSAPVNSHRQLLREKHSLRRTGRNVTQKRMRKPHKQGSRKITCANN